MTRKALFGLAALAAAGAGGGAWAQTDQAPAAAAPSGVAPYVISIIEKACIPMTGGQDVKSVAQATGLKHSREVWVLQLPGVQRISVSPPTVANPTLCTLTVQYEVDQTKPLVDSLGNWAASQSPALAPLGEGYQVSPGVTGWTWSADSGDMHEGLVFNAQRTADGKPLGKGYDVATVLFSRGKP